MTEEILKGVSFFKTNLIAIFLKKGQLKKYQKKKLEM